MFFPLGCSAAGSVRAAWSACMWGGWGSASWERLLRTSYQQPVLNNCHLMSAGIACWYLECSLILKVSAMKCQGFVVTEVPLCAPSSPAASKSCVSSISDLTGKCCSWLLAHWKFLITFILRVSVMFTELPHPSVTVMCHGMSSILCIPGANLHILLEVWQPPVVSSVTWTKQFPFKWSKVKA